MQEAWYIIYKARQKIEILEKDVQRKNDSGYYRKESKNPINSYNV
jgi:hypothetical protein